MNLPETNEYEIEIFKAKGTPKHKWHFKIVHRLRPDKPIATSEGYYSRFNALRQARKLGLRIYEYRPSGMRYRIF